MIEIRFAFLEGSFNSENIWFGPWLDGIACPIVAQRYYLSASGELVTI